MTDDERADWGDDRAPERWFMPLWNAPGAWSQYDYEPEDLPADRPPPWRAGAVKDVAPGALVDATRRARRALQLADGDGGRGGQSAEAFFAFAHLACAGLTRHPRSPRWLSLIGECFAWLTALDNRHTLRIGRPCVAIASRILSRAHAERPGDLVIQSKLAQTLLVSLAFARAPHPTRRQRRAVRRTRALLDSLRAHAPDDAWLAQVQAQADDADAFLNRRPHRGRFRHFDEHETRIEFPPPPFADRLDRWLTHASRALRIWEAVNEAGPRNVEAGPRQDKALPSARPVHARLRQLDRISAQLRALNTLPFVGPYAETRRRPRAARPLTAFSLAPSLTATGST